MNAIMHELAVTESIVDIVRRHAEEAGAERVMRIHLVIGDMSSIVDDSVQFYFDYIAANTVADGAELVFERVPLGLQCGACQHTWHPESGDWTCPACGQARAIVVAGREFYVDSIEVE
jgi:hydrogenase nickel incorporation protein HypA/HybF